MSTRGGKRGNKARQEFSSEVRKDASRLIPAISVTARQIHEGKYSEWLVAQESYDPISDSVIETLIEDKSLTAKQFLRLGRQVPTRGITIKGRQLDRATGQMIETTDIKILKMSDKTLLSRAKPDSNARAMASLKRQASRGQKRISYPDADFAVQREKTSDLIDIDLTAPLGRSNVSAKGIRLG
jgi:hypothetical protein